MDACNDSVWFLWNLIKNILSNWIKYVYTSFWYYFKNTLNQKFKFKNRNLQKQKNENWFNSENKSKIMTLLHYNAPKLINQMKSVIRGIEAKQENPRKQTLRQGFWCRWLIGSLVGKHGSEVGKGSQPVKGWNPVSNLSNWSWTLLETPGVTIECMLQSGPTGGGREQGYFYCNFHQKPKKEERCQFCSNSFPLAWRLGVHTLRPWKASQPFKR